MTVIVRREADAASVVPSVSALRWHFAAEPRSVGVARRWARGVAAGVLPAGSGVVDDVAVVVSELAANAVRHGSCGAGEGFTVALGRWRPGGVRVEVADGGAGLPVRTAVGAAAESGRGLGLVDALSVAWGWYRTPGVPGKTVFAYLGPPPDPCPDLFPPPPASPAPAPPDGCPACTSSAQTRSASHPADGRGAADDADVVLRRHQAEAQR